ncbi:MAG: Penicillin-binding protein 4* [Candidatus Heimdallarchaeota archaeon LC_3]|nr:MAG: Penicillin-binding protein 4* [Candidatus Heimdallarchaeota archaeon LC_3]
MKRKNYSSEYMLNKGLIKIIEKSIVSLMTEFKIPRLAEVLVENTKILYKNAFGNRDLVNESPFELNSLTGIGSVIKPFICLSIMKLAELGKLSINNPVSNYIEFDLEDKNNPIVIKHLMSHSSGIPNLGTIEASIGRKVFDLETYLPISDKKEEILRFINTANEEITYKPGEHFFYSNESYVLLGLIIEKVSGIKDFTDFINEEIFKPLSMNDTFFNKKDLKGKKNISIAYKTVLGKCTPQEQYFGYSGKAPGGMIPSINELINYLFFNMNNGEFNNKKILSDENFREMSKSSIFIDKEELFGEKSYGFGWSITSDFFGAKLISHSGSMKVSGSFIGYIPEKKIGAIVIGNNGLAPLSMIGELLLMSALEIDIINHPVMKTKSVFNRLIGKYNTFLNHYQAEVVTNDGILFVKMNYYEFRKMNNPLIVKNLEKLEFYIYVNGMKIPVKFLIHENNKIDMLIERNCFHKQ